MGNRDTDEPFHIFQAAALIVLTLPTVAAAHHSQQPFFHMEENIELTGSVVRFEFRNPHPIIYLDVTDPSGETVRWEIEGPTTIYLQRNGWTRDSLVPGESITVRGAPPKKVDVHAMAGREVEKSDGSRLRLYADDARRVLEQ
jgi:hypothetical protein